MPAMSHQDLEAAKAAFLEAARAAEVATLRVTDIMTVGSGFSFYAPDTISLFRNTAQEFVRSAKMAAAAIDPLKQRPDPPPRGSR